MVAEFSGLIAVRHSECRCEQANKMAILSAYTTVKTNSALTHTEAIKDEITVAINERMIRVTI